MCAQPTPDQTAARDDQSDGLSRPDAPQPPSFLIDPATVEKFDRGGGVVTLPYVGEWNSDTTHFTTGQTVFSVGRGLPLHSHNCEEHVLILEGQATAQIGDDYFDLEAGQASWVPADVPHRFFNRGETEMRIFWIYGLGKGVTRTITETGETIAHLSANDKGARDK
jgi:mannose-6-phosphate isomerase-like protein (cupin superfamily)